MDEELGFLLRTFGAGVRCPSEEVLAAYLEERLSRRERKVLEGHLKECPLCRREAQAAGAAFSPGPSLLLRTVALAAAGLLLALGVFFFSRPSGPLVQAEGLLAQGREDRALALLDGWLRDHGDLGEEGRARCLSLLLGKPPGTKGPSRSPAQVFRGKTWAPPRLLYPLGTILDRRPGFILENGEEDLLLQIWPLSGERGKGFSLRVPAGREVLAYPQGRPSLLPGDYAVQVRGKGLSRISWFHVMDPARVESLNREWKLVEEGISQPFLRNVARVRFCLSHGLVGEAMILLRLLKPRLLASSPEARGWLDYLEGILCSGS